MGIINLSGFKNLEKAYQEGIYSDSPANRKLGRVGMTYKQAAEKAAKEESQEKPETTKKTSSLLSKEEINLVKHNPKFTPIGKDSDAFWTEQGNYFHQLRDIANKVGINTEYIAGRTLVGKNSELKNKILAKITPIKATEEKPEAAKSEQSEKKSKEAEIHDKIMGLKRGDLISIHEDAKYGEGRGSVSLNRAKYKILSQDTRGKEGELQAKEFKVKNTLTEKTSYLSSHILEFLLEDNNLSINR